MPSIDLRNRAIAFCRTGRLPGILSIVLILTTLGRAASHADSGDRRRPPSFRTDIAPLLSKAGCNMGACHGNLNGKGGFKLSLRGEDPSFDYQSLTHDQSGRRISRIAPGIELDHSQADRGHPPRRWIAVRTRLDRGPDSPRLDRRGSQR